MAKLVTLDVVICDSAELSHSLNVSDRRQNMPTSAQKRSESLRVGLWEPCRIFLAWFGPALRPKAVRHRRFPAGSFKVCAPFFSSAEHIVVVLRSW